MRIGRRTIAIALAGAALPVAGLLGPSAGAASWSFYKLSQSNSGSEPGIDIGYDADGNEIVYVHGTFGVPSHNKAWKLQPGDAAFRPISFTTPYNRLPGGGDADIAFRGDDVWFIDLWLGSNSIQYSPDKGQTWTRGTPFTSLPLSDRQWISLGDTVVNADGERQTTVYVTYQTVQPGDGMWLSRSRDNGLTWDFHAPIGGLPSPAAGIPAHIVSDGSKTVAVAVNTSNKFTVAVSKDEGATWTLNNVSGGDNDASVESTLTGLSMNPLNPQEMAIVYEAGPGADDGGVHHKTVVRVSHDGGSTWSDMIRLDPNASPTGPMDWFPWIDYRGDKIAVAWYQSSMYVPQRDPNLGTAQNSWDVWYSESLDDGATFSTPEPIGTGPVKMDGICTNGLGCDEDRELGDFMQLAIDTSGTSWITFVKAAAGAPLPGAGIYVAKQPTPPAP